jgi:hypothetical protein
MRFLPRRAEMTPKESTGNRIAGGSLLCVLLLALLIAGTIQAFARQQEQFDSTPQVRRPQGEATAESEVETAYVAVLDKHGNPVTDLRRSDFSISENNVPQEIVEVTSAAETPLVIAMMVDLSGSTRSDKFGDEKLQAFSSFFPNTLQSSDEAFVAVFANRAVGLRGRRTILLRCKPA